MKYKVNDGQEYTLAELKDIAYWAQTVVKAYRANNKRYQDCEGHPEGLKVVWVCLFRLLESVEGHLKTHLPRDYNAQYYD